MLRFLNLPILFPVLMGLGLLILHPESRKTRNLYLMTAVLITSALSFAAIGVTYVQGSDALACIMVRFNDVFSISLRIDGASMVFGTIVSTLWPIITVYAIDYMSHEGSENRFFSFWLMAYGVVLGVATVVLVLPSILLQMDGAIRKYRHPALKPNFEKLNAFVVRHRHFFVGLFLVLFLPAVYSNNHTQVYYKLDQSLPQDMPSIVATDKLKDEFNMASSHFIVMRDDLSRAKMKELEEAIDDIPGITSVVAYDKLISGAIPDFFIPDDVKELCKAEGYQMLMVNSEYVTASNEVSQQLAELTELLHTYDPGAYITGEAAMTDDLITVSDSDFRITSYLSILAILIIVAFTFRSLTVPILLVATIELAIFINQGIPYFTGTVIAFVAPTVIGCVQLGATVDYAILMTTRFQEELQKGRDRKEAIQIAAASSDVSILTSALVFFCSTLGVALISTMDIVSSICLMLSRGAIISALISMFILPSVLVVFEPIISKTTLWWRKAKPSKASKASKTGEAALTAAEKH